MFSPRLESFVAAIRLGSLFVFRYRFRRDDISYLCSVLRPYLKRRTMRSHALTVEEQVLIALRFFVCDSFYEVIADGIAVTKATVEYVLHSVASALSSMLNTYVIFPESNSEISDIKPRFFSMASMPNVIGVIDCTHIHIQAPHEREWEYVNRKGRHSINVQLIGDADLKITNCVIRWPGSRFQNTPPDGILLGDSGYPLLLWLMTPFSNVTNASQLQYNIAHSSTRGTTERINGILKRRFARLSYLRVEPKKRSSQEAAPLLTQTRRQPLPSACSCRYQSPAPSPAE
uniref:Putative nuclease HARBI1 n=1 Tax=Acanthochromis polyacanthus TaxID=80966 RepID=A0A3Q1EBL3_9TELE